jgi:hypothetical protein
MLREPGVAVNDDPSVRSVISEAAAMVAALVAGGLR